MTPTQFCIWLNGYSAAKPEALDDNIRSKLDEIVAQLVAEKLRSEREQSEMELKKREYELQMALQQAKLQAAQQISVAKSAYPLPGSNPLGGGIVYASNTAGAQGVAVPK